MKFKLILLDLVGKIEKTGILKLYEFYAILFKLKLRLLFNKCYDCFPQSFAKV